MEDNIIELKNVSFGYGDFPVLEDIDFTVKKNDFLAIMGPNGGGKTTLLKIILGLIKPDSGTVKIFGEPPIKGRKLIGYLQQNANFDMDFPISVFEVVIMGRYKGFSRRYSARDTEAALEALEKVGMLEYKNRHISVLSGGQLQRMLIARAIARRPRLLLRLGLGR